MKLTPEQYRKLQKEIRPKNYIGPKSLKVNVKNKAKIDKMIDKKTLPALKKELQEAFNRFIRLRDTKYDNNQAFFICISCNHPKAIDQMNAGHYWPVGGHEAVRFDEDNVHGQCIKCNNFDSNGVVTKRYTVNLVKKIGQQRYDSLAARRFNKSKLFVFEVELLIAEYKSKTEKLKVSLLPSIQ
jgi:hypothetical protein